MLKPICLAVVCCIALLMPALAAATLRPDASPQAHGRHVTILPSCPEVPLPWNAKNAYVEVWQGNTILCASLEGNRYAATMTFAGHSQSRSER